MKGLESGILLNKTALLSEFIFAKKTDLCMRAFRKNEGEY